MTRIVLLASTIGVNCPAAGAVTAEERTVYLGNPSDDRVARCGIIVSRQEIAAMIEPFLDGGSGIEGRLDLDVTKRSPSGQNRSRQSSSFSNGKLGTTIISMERPAELDVMLRMTDRSGKTLCAMHRSITIGSVFLKNLTHGGVT